MTNKTESRGQKTVLIVEDQALMRQILRDFLQGAFPSCNFREAVGGVSALQVAVGIASTAHMEAS